MENKQFNILIVDDESLFSNNIRDMLEEKHKEKIAKITVLSNFMKAVHMVQIQKFDLIVTDMKDSNGNDTGLIVAQFAKRANKDSYIIGMSSSSKAGGLFRDAGADDFIDKFWDKETRIKILDKFFKKK